MCKSDCLITLLAGVGVAGLFLFTLPQPGPAQSPEPEDVSQLEMVRKPQVVQELEAVQEPPEVDFTSGFPFTLFPDRHLRAWVAYRTIWYKMTPEEVIAAVGVPPGDYRTGKGPSSVHGGFWGRPGEPQGHCESWYCDDGMLHVSFDRHGKVDNAVVEWVSDPRPKWKRWLHQHVRSPGRPAGLQTGGPSGRG